MKKIIKKLSEIESSQCKKGDVFSYKLREKICVLTGGLGSLDVKTTNALHVYILSDCNGSVKLSLNEFVLLGSLKEILEKLEKLDIWEE